MFINLNVRSHYSLLMSGLSIKDIVDFAVANNQKYVALTDFNNMHGAVEFFDLAKSKKLIPIIGLEIFEKKSQSLLVLIAKNNKGYINLLKISSHIMCEQDFVLEKFLEDLIVIVKDGNFQLKAHKDFYVAESGHENSVALSFVNCKTEKDAYLVNVLQAIKNDQILDLNSDSEIELWKEKSWFLTEAEAKKEFSKKQIENLEKIISQTNWDINQFHTDLLKFPTPKKIAKNIYLQSLCKEGLTQRLGNSKVPKVYIERLKYELDVINKMGYDDYFLIVYDLVNFAKKNNIIVGPGRGSAVGSLVSYSLHITDIDPLAHDLIFERFLNPERQSMPDIDIDIMDTRREEVIEYLFNKYGNDHVAHIVTFQRIKAKMAIRDVGRVLNIKLSEVDKISKLISTMYDEDLDLAVTKSQALAAKQKEYPLLFRVASALIGIPRQVGTHAAGVVLGNDVLTEIIPIQMGINNHSMSQFSMEYLERFGLLKMDLLGLKNLTILDRIIKVIKKIRKVDIVLSKIPLNDKKTFDLLSIGDTNGIFQLESPGMRNVLIKMKPNCIEDISITSSLFRPGPQENIPSFIARRNKKETITYISESLKPILSSTNGIIVYQEQVIQIAQTVAKFTPAEADLFRRAISKKNDTEMKHLQNQFISGAVKNGYSKSDSEQIYNYIYQFANYGFNHSHAIAYSLIGYWLAYFKANYPLEFLANLLSMNSGSSEKVSIYINEAISKNIQVLAPIINLSQPSFSIYKKAILFGFDVIKGIGNEAMRKIIEVREQLKDKNFTNYVDAVCLLSKNKISQKIIQSLIYSGAFDSFKYNRKTMIENLNNIIERSAFILSKTTNYEVVNCEMNDEEVNEYNNLQAETIGVYLAEHPFKKIKSKLSNSTFDFIDLKSLVEQVKEYGQVFVKVISIRTTKTKAGKEMAFARIEDDTSKSDLTIWPQIFVKIKDYFHRDLICVLSAKNEGKGLIMMKLFAIYDESKKELIEDWNNEK